MKLIMFVDGYYYYIETSAPRRRNDNARFVSPTVAVTAGANTTKCFSFWYNMYGIHVYKMNIYVKHGINFGRPIYTKQGTQGQAWKQALVDISSTTPFQVCVFYISISVSSMLSNLICHLV